MKLSYVYLNYLGSTSEYKILKATNNMFKSAVQTGYLLMGFIKCFFEKETFNNF